VKRGQSLLRKVPSPKQSRGASEGNRDQEKKRNFKMLNSKREEGDTQPHGEEVWDDQTLAPIGTKEN